jgi:hypothetical protein
MGQSLVGKNSSKVSRVFIKNGFDFLGKSRGTSSVLIFSNRYNKSKSDLIQAEQKVQQLETRYNQLKVCQSDKKFLRTQ